MLKINKTQEPPYFTQAKAGIKDKNTPSAWENKHISAIREKLRKDILTTEQNSLCAYCEAKIASDKQQANIDHFVKRSLNQGLTLAYDNLLVSCNFAGRCSDSKDKSIRDLVANLKIINPVADDPHKYFDYLNTGEIFAKATDNKNSMEKAEFTIEAFQLNQKSLVERRKADGIRIASWLERNDKNLTQQELSDLIKAAFPSFISFQSIIIRRHTAHQSHKNPKDRL